MTHYGAFVSCLVRHELGSARMGAHALQVSRRFKTSEPHAGTHGICGQTR